MIELFVRNERRRSKKKAGSARLANVARTMFTLINYNVTGISLSHSIVKGDQGHERKSRDIATVSFKLPIRKLGPICRKKSKQSQKYGNIASSDAGLHQSRIRYLLR